MLLTTVPVRRILTANALRLTPASLQSRSRLVLPHRDPHHANFSTTPRRSASEEPEAQAQFERQQRVARVLQENPEIAQLIVDFTSILESEGLKIDGQFMPSKMDMIRIITKPKVREVMENLVTKLKDAGIDRKEIVDYGMSMLQRK